jgi:hypothetical protein
VICNTTGVSWLNPAGQLVSEEREEPALCHPRNVVKPGKLSSRNYPSSRAELTILIIAGAFLIEL